MERNSKGRYTFLGDDFFVGLGSVKMYRFSRCLLSICGVFSISVGDLVVSRIVFLFSGSLSLVNEVDS